MKTDFGVFGGIFYPISLGKFSIPIGGQLHFVFAENDTLINLKFGVGIRFGL